MASQHPRILLVDVHSPCSQISTGLISGHFGSLYHVLRYGNYSLLI